ncbi:MAG TPA: Fe-S cluster assembly protein NifU [Acidobacteriota bacterium]|nr:Fe-S cluster assembly protein NifU [Acidobacteriota bacterium]HNR37790.1 Fe-S cluster assembly protein NifU [Acidobacteriota bacterium]HNT99213.1 Fe-S cluster assembly protein NifU [Acidobacteriota bacterium]HPB29296.1 Fe-S cluster assembly protein NifU [Acidobacteriota bacterium]HQP75210.1 Fe-S cluster assembly protein NifU [Acidobacteriota bacterium]
MWEYTDKVKDHFFNPRNVGDLPGADAVGEVGSIACGDALRIYLKVDDQKRIVDVRFKTFGCGSAIAAASALTEMVKGKTLDEAMQITNQQIADFLGGLPPEKMHCSVMGREALEAAVANYYGLERKHLEEEDEGRIVCHCFGVTEGLIRKVVRENNLNSIEEVTNYCKAGGGCQSCHMDIEEIIREVRKERVVTPAKQPARDQRKLTNVERILKIKEILEEEIRPSLQQDGGDIELVDVEGSKVLVAMRGTCASCPSSELTIRWAVEAKLREFVAEDLQVVEVKS